MENSGLFVEVTGVTSLTSWPTKIHHPWGALLYWLSVHIIRVAVKAVKLRGHRVAVSDVKANHNI